MTATITIRQHGEDGVPQVRQVSRNERGELVVHSLAADGPHADPAYIASSWDDLAEQINRDGHWLDGYLDDTLPLL